MVRAVSFSTREGTILDCEGSRFLKKTWNGSAPSSIVFVEDGPPSGPRSLSIRRELSKGGRDRPRIGFPERIVMASEGHPVP